MIANGGTVVIGETTEIIGAEHVLAERCEDPAIEAKLYEIVNRFEQEVARMDEDMCGGNPSPGNIAGGLSTIEENRWAASVNAGVIEYAESGAQGRPLFHGFAGQ